MTVDSSVQQAFARFGDTPSPAPHRRDFLKLVTAACAGIGSAAAAWAFIDLMNPSGDVIAAGAPIDIDLTKLAMGQQVVVRWHGSPIFITNRPLSALLTLQKASLVSHLSDPDSDVYQQPVYARNWHRSIRPNYSVLVGVCTHLGCLPEYRPNPDASTPAPNWPGGYFCPCHGSKYDLAGRVYKGVPAPYNLPVPPHHFPTQDLLRVGRIPPGQKVRTRLGGADVGIDVFAKSGISRQRGDGPSCGQQQPRTKRWRFS